MDLLKENVQDSGIKRDTILYQASAVTTPAPCPAEASSQTTTKKMSLWCKMMKAVMLIQVVTYHYAKSNNYKHASYFDIFMPHLFSSHAYRNNGIFYMFAGYFSLSHFEKLNSITTKEYCKKYVIQYAKRYIQLRSTLIVYALGYQPLLYFIFGEEGRQMNLSIVRTRAFWLQLLIPWYYKPRLIDENIYYKTVGISTWYILELMNIEALFYIFYFYQHIMRKAVKNTLVWLFLYLGIATAVSLALKFTGHVTKWTDDYLTGNALYLFRMLMTRPEVDEKLNRFKSWRFYKYFSIAATIVLIYLAMILSRFQSKTVIYPIFLLFGLDLLPEIQLNPFFKAIFNELSRLQMEIYIVHNSFIQLDTPRSFPSLVPKDLNTLTPLAICWFIAWQLPIMFAALGYPLWWISRPINELVSIVTGQKVLNKQQRIIYLVCIVIILVMILVAQLGVLGHGVCGPVETPTFIIKNHMIK